MMPIIGIGLEGFLKREAGDGLKLLIWLQDFAFIRESVQLEVQRWFLSQFTAEIVTA